MPAVRSIDVQTFLNEHPFSRFQWLIFALCFCIVLLDGFDTAAIGYIAPSLITEWGVERPALAPVLSAALFGLAFGALSSVRRLSRGLDYPAVRLAQRLDVRRDRAAASGITATPPLAGVGALHGRRKLSSGAHPQGTTPHLHLGHRHNIVRHAREISDVPRQEQHRRGAFPHLRGGLGDALGGLF